MNRIVKLGPNNSQVQPQSDSTEVYTDISLDSVYQRNAYKKDYLPKVSKSINLKAVQNSIDNIFSFIPGERVLDPEFGSELKFHLYEGINEANMEKIAAEVNEQLDKYDKRVVIDKLQNITTINDINDNTVAFRIIYHIKGLPKELYEYDYSYIKGI